MNVDWVAVDWGSSNLRIWAMSSDCKVLGQKQSQEGAGGLTSEEFEGVLLGHIGEWLDDKAVPPMPRPIPVLACGMVGSRNGWHEAPYDTVPAKPAKTFVKVKSRDARIKLRIISGLQQARPADVMRGEETQIAGFLMSRPEFDGVICLPGTHSKWVKINNGEVQGFQTAMMGEVFALLSKQSVLRHSLGQWRDDLFLTSVREAIARPQHALSTLFNIRASALLDGQEDGVSRLSGALTGLELAGARNFWQEQNVVIIGAEKLARLYAMALNDQGTKAELVSADQLTLAGLIKNYKEWA